MATAAAGADSEAAFFARLRAEGLLVRERFSRRDPGEVTGYAVALPGHLNRQGRPVWFGGGRLAADLTLPKLRHRWTGAPAERRHDFPARDAMWSEAIAATRQATARLQSCRAGSPDAADIAWATADMLRVTARRLGGDPHGLLRRAADAYDRAARPPHGRIPISTAGNGLRAAARILANTSTDDDRITRAMATLLNQLAALVDTITRLRMLEQRTAQSVAAAKCSDLLCNAHERAAARSVPPEQLRNKPAEPERTMAEPVAVAARDFPTPPVVADERLHPEASDPMPVRRPEAPHRLHR